MWILWMLLYGMVGYGFLALGVLGVAALIGRRDVGREGFCQTHGPLLGSEQVRPDGHCLYCLMDEPRT